MRLCGVDYGSKLAGTTVICTLDTATGTAHFERIAPKQDADRFLLDRLPAHRPELIFLDAPLSLPGVYRGLPGCRDYFYRRADKELRAMSPMFLGGLTARAMQLKGQLEERGLPVYETYPAAQAQRLDLKREGYKKELTAIPAVLRQVQESYPFISPETAAVFSWHHLDALLALVAAIRFAGGKHQAYGDAAEGLIMV